MLSSGGRMSAWQELGVPSRSQRCRTAVRRTQTSPRARRPSGSSWCGSSRWTRGPSRARTLLNEDFREMLSALSAEAVEFMLVGAYALAAHGLPRATGDMDLWLRCSAENAERDWRALARFGAPMEGASAADLAKPGVVVQVGAAPCRIDLLTSVDGVDFDDAWPRRKSVRVGELEVPVISKADLIRNKQACARPQDIADIDALGRLRDE